MRRSCSIGDLLPGNKDKLREIYLQIATAEARIWLFRQLLDRNIATRDVQSFVETQADLKRESKNLDMATITAAMRAKYKDTIENLGRLRKEGSSIRSDLLRDIGGKKHKLRRVMKSIKNETKKLKEDLLKKFKRKVEHLTNVQRKRQEHQKKTIQTVTPLNLRKYSSLTIFEPSTSFPERERNH